MANADTHLITLERLGTYHNKLKEEFLDNIISDAERTKLSGIEAGAQVHIAPTTAEVKSAGGVTQVKVGTTGYDPTSGVVTLPAYPATLPASDVSAWAKASTKPSYTANEVGAIPSTDKGANNGVATLGSDGKVPSSQLPSYVDDVLEYNAKSNFPSTGEGGKIYVDTSNNTTWRWSGTVYTQIKGDLAIGTSAGTAADGKVVADHIADTSNPHGVTKNQVGLGNVTNNAQVKGLSSGTTSGHVVTWGADGYTVADSGFTIGKSVPSNAVFTDKSVSAASNHYTPTRDSSNGDKSANATGATASWGIDVVKGVTLQTDGKGHVTGITVTSGKIPAEPSNQTIKGNGTAFSANDAVDILGTANSITVTANATNKTITIAPVIASDAEVQALFATA